MSIAFSGVTLPDMAKRKAVKAIETDPVNLRVPRELMIWVDEYRESHPMKPTQTQVFLEALALLRETVAAARKR